MDHLPTTIYKQVERTMMNPMEALQYSPRKGDVIIYNDGSYTEIMQDLRKGSPSVKAKFHALGSEPSEISSHVPAIRKDMIQGKCHLCRKEVEDVQDTPDSTQE